MEGRGLKALLVGSMMIGFFGFHHQVLAVESTDVSQLRQTIAQKKATISSLNSQLGNYKAKIKILAGKSASLQNDIAMLENEMAMSQLDIASSQNQIDQETLELRIIDSQLAETEKELSQRREMLSDLLFALNKNDRHSIIDVVLNIGKVGDIFEAAQQLISVNETMKSALEATKLTQSDLIGRQTDREAKVSELSATEQDLQKKTDELDLRKNAKMIIAQSTNESENQYRTLMSQLRSEQQSVTNEVSSMQGTLEEKLRQLNSKNGGNVAGDSTISWPVHGIITALFHDPTYPFRNLFEHSGMDIAVPVGTAIEAAAPGIVARVHKGQQYGYYVMIVHANGLATLYAHMSRIDVEQDQFVTRGQVIGLSGGRPGHPGAGFSTGPHVHFEVRVNGIPRNPLAYLDRSQL